MSKIVVAGLTNIETTVQVDGFPIPYTPVRFPFFGVESAVSGVGYNVAKALTTLGHEVRFASLVGQDWLGQQVGAALGAVGIATAGVIPQLAHTPQSVVMFDPAGQRAITTDLKDIQDQRYPTALFDELAEDCAAAVICNINFARPLLLHARQRGLLIATDVHAYAASDEDYNRDWFVAADVLFMSHERLPLAPRDWITHLWQRFAAPIIVIGLGAEGALLGLKAEQQMIHVPAVAPRPIISTIGAGDALFSAFLHGFLGHRDPVRALQQAVVFAGYKIGATGAADGFLDADGLDRLASEAQTRPNNAVGS